MSQRDVPVLQECRIEQNLTAAVGRVRIKAMGVVVASGNRDFPMDCRRFVTSPIHA